MMENEILSTAFADMFLEFGERKRDLKLIGEMMKRDKRAADKIARRISRGTEKELRGVKETLKRDKRAVELLTGILGASSGGTVNKEIEMKTNKRKLLL